jgi:hypothetical protein
MTMGSAAEGTEITVRCLLLFGGMAELEVPGQDEPVRQSAAQVAGEAGVDVADLPGRLLTARLAETPEAGRVLSGFRLAG